jgi:hypothetical protein
VSGVCTCGSGADADADADGDADAGDTRDQVEDAAADDAEVGPCDGYRVPVQERPGATEGVVCRRVSVEQTEKMLTTYAGQGPYVTFKGSPSYPRPLLLYDRPNRCITVADDVSEPVYDDPGAYESSIDGRLVAYSVVGERRAEGLLFGELRLLDLDTMTRRTLVTLQCSWTPGSSSISIDFPTLHYPWVTWRDVREETYYNWLPFAYNIETGEERDLCLDRDTGLHTCGSVMVDSDGRLVVAGCENVVSESNRWLNVCSIDLETGEQRLIDPVEGRQFWPAITPEWIVWLDQRSHPECDSMMPCYTDIYGYHRPSGEVRALVVAGDSMQGPQMDATGDWVAYEDQRDGTDVVESYDGAQNIYAYHLPTGTEIRVTDWEGFQMNPQVVDRLDGTYSVLLVDELDFRERLYRLWDCTLPAIE